MAEVLEFAPSIPDLDERAQALDITRSFIVEAPAGSGKTGLLIQRLLKLLASERITDPAQILAITFTRKATHEMRDRVVGQLAAAAAGTVAANAFDRETRPLAEAALGRDRQLGWKLLDHPQRLNILTIDSFCTQVARSLPVLSGAGGQAPVEDASELYHEAAARTLDLLGSEDHALTRALETLLLHRDGDLGNCAGLIAEMLEWRDQWGGLVPLAGDHLTDEYLETVTLPKLEKTLEHAVCRGLTQLDDAMPDGLADELASLAHRLSHVGAVEIAGSPIAVCRELQQAPGLAARDLDHWRAFAHLLIAPSSKGWRKARGITRNIMKFEISKADAVELAALIEDISGNERLREALCGLTKLPPLKYPPQQWRVAKALFRVLSRALVELQLVFAARGECDFAEFSLVAREALRHAGAVEDLAASAGFNLEHLLVDEMQDTSSSQYELIRLLTEHWDGAGQTVFLVGDPKQSIYLFRQARVARFMDTLHEQRLGDLRLTALYLTTNFRSQARLVTAFNTTFSKLFATAPDEANAETVAYKDAVARRPGAAGPDLMWHARPLPYSSDQRVRAEARTAAKLAHAAEIRAIVERWRARPLPADRAAKPWKIAVLVRNRAHLMPIVRAFKQEPPIAYRAVKTEPLAERQEVLDLLSLTRALLDPTDRTAWLALLRTPWCGLTLKDLHLLAGADDYTWHEHTVLSLIRERGELLSKDGAARLKPFWMVMSAALEERGQMPLSRWVERTWRAFGAEAFHAAGELANTERYFGLLDELEARPGPVSMERLQAMMKRLYAAESTQADAVDLMTIHNAKGLEWDVVLVPELESGSAANRSKLLNWIEVEGGDELSAEVAHGMIAPVQAKGKQSEDLSRWMRSIDNAREAAERKRLFYVVCTRAREELHLFAAPERRQGSGFNLKPDSLLKAAWPAAALHFEAIAAAGELQEPGVLDDIAAVGMHLVQPKMETVRTLLRVPLAAFPAAARVPRVPMEEAPSRLFERPQGGFGARTVGNAMHDFLQVMTQRLAGGATVAGLSAELPGWSARISNVLRAGGLGPDEITQASARIERGLRRTLEDADGRWVVSPHARAATEAALAFEGGSIRLDRSFVAGAEPGQEGQSHLWIIDYKTGTHADTGLDEYLAGEKKKYAPQLETYGHQLAARGLPVRLGLFYPLLPRLIWWRFEG